ncbi:rhomboid family intramembrane serine protease [Isoptericola sp. b490]|uniref:rhomboid family intramembrane serine protease n=1 Tax=Actinotalea lenta TaxID=3064654 RepID=UPI0027131FC8|nr:rhomboid family intramembrane serine protease [Isoptericola sp. b490]MDO8122115.1 rhomboid family intramembrane serine protease [Isoptericola sp. b490]
MITYTLIGINVVVFLLQQALGMAWTYQWVLVPARAAGEPWTMLTSAFLHGGLLHIGFNMYALWILGQFLENALGRWRFLTAYLVSALGGSVVYLVMIDPASRAWGGWVYGASGAVFGLFGIILVVLRRLGRSASGIVAILVLNAVLGFVIPNIAWQAHLGGLLTGLVLGLAYAYAPKNLRTLASVLAPVVVVAVLVLLVTTKLASA